MPVPLMIRKTSSRATTSRAAPIRAAWTRRRIRTWFQLKNPPRITIRRKRFPASRRARRRDKRRAKTRRAWAKVRVKLKIKGRARVPESVRSRHPNFPDVPTFAEAGLPDYSPTAWIGLFTPAGTPNAVVEKLSDAMQKAAMQNPELMAKWRSYGGELKAQTPADFSAFLKTDNQLWGQAIRGAGIKLD